MKAVTELTERFTMDSLIYLAVFFSWFPLTSVGPADRTSLKSQIPNNPYSSVCKSLDSLKEKIRSGHLPDDTNKVHFKQILSSIKKEIK